MHTPPSSDNSFFVRDAEPEDMAAVSTIFNHAVRHTFAIWQEEETDETARRQWLQTRRAAGQPVLVAVSGTGTVLGFASYGSFRPYYGFRYTAEHSVYVDENARGRGVAGALMEELMRRAQANGIRVLVAAVEAQNEASVHLHKKLGFVQTGLMPGVGIKFGKTLDLLLMQKNMGN